MDINFMVVYIISRAHENGRLESSYPYALLMILIKHANLIKSLSINSSQWILTSSKFKTLSSANEAIVRNSSHPGSLKTVH